MRNCPSRNAHYPLPPPSSLPCSCNSDSARILDAMLPKSHSQALQFETDMTNPFQTLSPICSCSTSFNLLSPSSSLFCHFTLSEPPRASPSPRPISIPTSKCHSTFLSKPHPFYHCNVLRTTPLLPHASASSLILQSPASTVQNAAPKPLEKRLC